MINLFRLTVTTEWVSEQAGEERSEDVRKRRTESMIELGSESATQAR